AWRSPAHRQRTYVENRAQTVNDQSGSGHASIATRGIVGPPRAALAQRLNRSAGGSPRDAARRAEGRTCEANHAVRDLRLIGLSASSRAMQAPTYQPIRSSDSQRLISTKSRPERVPSPLPDITYRPSGLKHEPLCAVPPSREISRRGYLCSFPQSISRIPRAACLRDRDVALRRHST